MTDADLPGFFHDADEASRRGQRQTLLLSRVRLMSAVVAAIGGAFKWKVGGGYDIWAFVALAGFFVALFAEILLWATHPEQKWNAGRAVAEQIKSLVWRYAVIGDPFTGPNAKHSLQLMIAEVVSEQGKKLPLASTNPTGAERREQLRAQPFPARRTAYREGRVRDQLEWYRRRATTNEFRANLWRMLLIAGEFVAILFAGARVMGAWDVDMSGVMAAAVAGGAAWLGLKQHENLFLGYAAAASDLALIYERLADVEEPEWAAAVAEAEGAISKEHSAWLASRPSAT
ncbi:hypothetical protein BBK82_29180 [Lentzea guizhouensis]|uniref:DUF4231 domain-containing protein n=1 Tax=Lentzea guizhouensis TaxID=1586287 RepID=A0A1B2HP84_9PSEU|nr:DUF4231 domain-containing protein [Lentzea guizhouensis]ANZ39516.1 hypothetical protein BBK82_29180 [Lentzea guizhouensis]